MAHQKRTSRWKIDRQVKFKLEGAVAFAEGQILDINLKGVCAALKIKLPVDEFVKLTICLHDNLHLCVEAWVVWHKAVDGRNIYGLYFTKLKDSDREQIYAFMRNEYPQIVNQNWWGIQQQKGGVEMENKKLEDKRIFERFNAKLPVRFLDVSSDRQGEAHTRDISAKGIGLVTSKELLVHSTLEMWVNLPDKGQPLYTRGEVVWTKPIGNEYHSGINLEKADLMGLGRVLRVI